MKIPSYYILPVGVGYQHTFSADFLGHWIKAVLARSQERRVTGELWSKNHPGGQQGRFGCYWKGTFLTLKSKEKMGDVADV